MEEGGHDEEVASSSKKSQLKTRVQKLILTLFMTKTAEKPHP